MYLKFALKFQIFCYKNLNLMIIYIKSISKVKKKCFNIEKLSLTNLFAICIVNFIFVITFFQDIFLSALESFKCFLYIEKLT